MFSCNSGRKHIYYKYKYDDNKFFVNKARVTRRGKQSKVQNKKVPPKYTRRLNISDANKSDLLSLCKSGVIPADCVYYYEGLPTSKSKSDRLPEPDTSIQEPEQNSD